MTIPPKSDPRWRDLLLGEERRFESLATTLVLVRLRDAVTADAARTESAIEELHGYFAGSSFAAHDLPSL